MKALLPLVALLLTAACGGTTDDTLESDAPETTAQADAGVATEEAPKVPLCPGSAGPDEEPDQCQTLVYALASGYCQKWTPCSELGQ